jgi:DNA-binding CsgD family transcriptional regulator
MPTKIELSYLEQGYRLPEGLTWEMVAERRARWAIADIFVPLAVAPGLRRLGRALHPRRAAEASVTRPRKIVAGETGEVRRVERAAAALSPIEREVLALSAGLHLGIAEIAARLGIGERRAERILARALRKFDRAMEEPRRRCGRFW